MHQTKATQWINYFIDPLHDFLTQLFGKQAFSLCGYQIGSYLVGQYIMKYGTDVNCKDVFMLSPLGMTYDEEEEKKEDRWENKGDDRFGSSFEIVNNSDALSFFIDNFSYRNTALTFSMFRQINIFAQVNLLTRSLEEVVGLNNLDTIKPVIGTLVDLMLLNKTNYRNSEWLFKLGFDSKLYDQTSEEHRFGKWLLNDDAAKKFNFSFIYDKNDTTQQNINEPFIDKLEKKINVNVDFIKGTGFNIDIFHGQDLGRAISGSKIRPVAPPQEFNTLGDPENDREEKSVRTSMPLNHSQVKI